MGHHSRPTMLKLRAALDALTVADDGVDGTAIYLYGEGWNFGEVADNARFVQATQLNMGGTGHRHVQRPAPRRGARRRAVRRRGEPRAQPGLDQRPVVRPERLVVQSGIADQPPSAPSCCCPPTRSASGSPATSPTTRSSTAPAATVTGADVDYNGAPDRLHRRSAGAHRLRRGPRQPDAVRHRPVPPPAGHVDRRPGPGPEPRARLHGAGPGRAVRPRRRGAAALEVAGPQQLRLG